MSPLANAPTMVPGMMFDEAVVLGRSGVLGDGGGVEGRGIDVHSPTRLEGVDHHKPDDKG